MTDKDTDKKQEETGTGTETAVPRPPKTREELLVLANKHLAYHEALLRDPTLSVYERAMTTACRDDIVACIEDMMYNPEEILRAVQEAHKQAAYANRN